MTNFEYYFEIVNRKPTYYREKHSTSSIIGEQA